MKIFLSCGEPSGDLYASLLVSELKKLNNNLQFSGLGQEKLSQNIKLLIDTSSFSVIGATEIIKILPQLILALIKLNKILNSEKPDLIILVDYPGFNLILAKLAKSKGIKICYYIPPILYGRKGNRGKKVAKVVDYVICLFKQEAELYKKYVPTYYVGHPLIDIVKPKYENEEFKKILNIENRTPLIGLLPGSREQEIKRLLPVMIAAAKKINEVFKESCFLLPVASERLKKLIYSFFLPLPLENIKIIDNNAYDVMQVSDLIVTASGTATLEATILTTPMIIVYKVSKLTEILAKTFVLKEKVIGLPNIIRGKRIVPELLQKEVTEERIANEVINLLKDSTQLEKMRANLKEVKEQLKDATTVSATKRAAQIILGL